MLDFDQILGMANSSMPVTGKTEMRVTSKPIPSITLILVVSTLVVSLSVNYLISGSLLGRIKITSLEPYGGYTLTHLLDFEWWRLLASQLIHVKQPHMFYNVVSLSALGYFLENTMGRTRFFLVWFVAGSVGTFVSTFTVPAPWNLGTGGSQAILALAGVCLVFYIKGQLKRKPVLAVLILTIVPAFAADLIFASNHLPKLGHVVPFCLGIIYALSMSRSSIAETV